MNNTKQENQTEEKIWYGPRKPFQFNEKTSMGKVLLEKLLKNPDHIAQICCHNDKQYSNFEIANLAINIARNLKKLGLRQGDVVAFCGNTTDYVPHLFVGTQLNGLIFYPMHQSLEKDGIKHILSISKPLVMVCDGSKIGSVKQAFNELNLTVPIYTMDDHIKGVPEISELFIGVGNEEPFSCELLEKGYLQIAAILCSSGTTGTPKSVCITQAELISLAARRFEPGVKLLSFSTISGVRGFVVLVGSLVWGFTSLRTKNAFSTKEFFEIIEKYKPSVISTPPSEIALLIGSKEIHTSDLSCVQRYNIGGGTAADPTLVSSMSKFFPRVELLVRYGMTEIPLFGISGGIYSGNQNVGKINTNIELKILNDDGVSLGVNETGEIVVRSQIPFAGYYGNTVTTRDICDKDGWIHTGDVGYMNEKDELFLLGRKKDILKYKGFHFSLTEIENVLKQIPDIVEASVCGIPDDVSHFLLAAMIVLKPDSSLTEEYVCQYVSEKLEFYKHLHGGVYFVRHIPKTPTGKNIRREVLQFCQKMWQKKKSAN